MPAADSPEEQDNETRSSDPIIQKPDQDSLLTCPMVQYLIQAFGKVSLNRNAVKGLMTQAAAQGRRAGYLVNHYNHTAGFKDFVHERVSQYRLAYPNAAMATVINHLNKFDYEGDWKGWLSWKADHAAICGSLPNACEKTIEELLAEQPLLPEDR